VDLSDRRAAANQRRPRQEPAEPLSGLYGSSKPRPLLASPKQLVGFRHDALIGAWSRTHGVAHRSTHGPPAPLFIVSPHAQWSTRLLLHSLAFFARTPDAFR
jgi:hypothetical protein